MYSVRFTNRAEKDARDCLRSGRGKELLKIKQAVEKDPYEPSQGFERLVGNLKGYCSRKIDKGNRFLYEVLPNDEGARDDDGNLYEGIVHVHEAWGHKYKKTK